MRGARGTRARTPSTSRTPNHKRSFNHKPNPSAGPHPRSAARKQWAASLEQRFPDRGGASLAKLYSLDLDPKAEQLLRHLTSLTPRQLEWRKSHPYMLCHTHALVEEDAPRSAALQLTGYARGAPSPNPDPDPDHNPSPDPDPDPKP